MGPARKEKKDAYFKVYFDKRVRDIFAREGGEISNEQRMGVERRARGGEQKRRGSH